MGEVKTAVRRLVRHSLPSRLPAVVVASMGRAGSTLVFEAIRHALARRRFGPMADGLSPFTYDSLWSLSGAAVRPGIVYKTHDYPHSLQCDSDVKGVFLFGRPSDAVISVFQCQQRYGDAWVRAHFQHLQSDRTLESLLSEDGLGIEAQIDAWRTTGAMPVLGLRYETLWDHADDLSAFLDLDVRLPEKRARTAGTAGLPDGLVDRIRRKYAALDEWVEGLDDIFRVPHG